MRLTLTSFPGHLGMSPRSVELSKLVTSEEMDGDDNGLSFQLPLAFRIFNDCTGIRRYGAGFGHNIQGRDSNLLLHLYSWLRIWTIVHSAIE